MGGKIVLTSNQLKVANFAYGGLISTFIINIINTDSILPMALFAALCCYFIFTTLFTNIVTYKVTHNKYNNDSEYFIWIFIMLACGILASILINLVKN